jgi:hypothetical protein
MSSSTPDESILTALQELVDAWIEEDFATAATKCSALLKKRKTLDSTVADSIQRLLLQCYLQQQDYAKIGEWAQPQTNTNGATKNRDLVLYAQYRQDDYESVSQQASKETPLEQHLLAQSYFHLNQMNPAMRVYQDLLKDESNSSLDEDAKMELLTNAVAVATSTVVPYVPSAPLFLEQADTFLEEHPEYCDLALNVGTVQCLTGSLSSSTKWLDMAKEKCSDPDDMVPIDINRNWSHHFWQKTEEEVQYDTSKGSAPQKAVAQLNHALFHQKPLATAPDPKWNVLQVRMYWYNRAVQQYQSQQFVECQESCQSLKKTLGKKKKKDAQPSTPAEWWWQARIDVILAHNAQQQQSSSKADAGAAIGRLEERLQGLTSLTASPTTDHAMAYVQLHLHSLQHPNATKEHKCALLKSLPESIQSQPAVVATLEALEEATSSSSSSNKKGKTGSPTDRADLLLEQGQYAEAAKLYEESLPAPSACNSDQLAFHLKRVQALAMNEQHEESTQLWETLVPLLDSAVEDPTVAATNSGEALEAKALPRSTTSHKTSASLAATAANADEAKPNRSKDSVLRQRARKREAYLKSLEEKGQYSADRPTKPNAERWIPKHERSRARRRGQNSRSAQGGGSQADAQRLDAAARRAGNVPSSAGPSTANLKVSQGGRKGGGRRRG